MKDLLNKYKHNKLTPDDLARLRLLLSDDDYKELESAMQADWENGEFDDIADDGRLQTIFAKIKDEIDEPRSVILSGYERKRYLRRIWQAVAAVLIPILIISTVYFYHSSTLQLDNATIVMTGKGENATIVLPDETKVSLKSLSKLSYSVAAFNRDERNITYDGEGKFSVKADKEHPFVIEIDGMQVKVLGTEFYVVARDDDPVASVYLETGVLQLTATVTGNSVVMSPNQLAMVNRETGILTLSTDPDKNDVSAIVNHELIFNNAPIADVIKRLEVNYNYKFNVSKDVAMLPFTGILPTNDILESIKILELAFNLNSNIKEKEITLSSR